jgi:hypothetical protein
VSKAKTTYLLAKLFKSQKIVSGCDDAIRSGMTGGREARNKMLLEKQLHAQLLPQFDDSHSMSAADSAVAYFFRDYHWRLNKCLCLWKKLVSTLSPSNPTQGAPTQSALYRPRFCSLPLSLARQRALDKR